jgi:leucyl/phenylalanyl-tRNA--protein transferase
MSRSVVNSEELRDGTVDPARAHAKLVLVEWQQLGECVWDFPPVETADDAGVVAVGADLEPTTLVYAYAHALFPMRLGGRSGPLGWWSPDPRGVMPLDGFHASRSLRRARSGFTITVDRAFGEVVSACGDVTRAGAWIDESFHDAYSELHRLGIAHSVEVRRGEDLVGGLYGVRLGGLFAGESMFHRVTDASKIALWATCELLALDDVTLFDVQWTTDHLRSLGAIDISRSEYELRLKLALS